MELIGRSAGVDFPSLCVEFSIRCVDTLYIPAAAEVFLANEHGILLPCVSPRSGMRGLSAFIYQMTSGYCYALCSLQFTVVK